MRLAPFLPILLIARLAVAQSTGATISGVVRDSIAGRPLAGATVQFVSVDGGGRSARSAVSDSLGRFAFDSVPDGRYALGFFHAMLDSLGLEPPVRELTVSGRRSMRTDLAIPSPARVRAAICGEASALDSSAVVMGFVRDARTGAPVADATVTAEWLEFTFTLDGIIRRVPRVDVTTGRSGWFAICKVPSAGTLTMRASRGADSTGLIDVEMPAERFVRSELFIGAARAVVRAETVRITDTLAQPPRQIHAGDGRLRGTVVSGASGQPLAGAIVSILDGPETRANSLGEWTLLDVPLGTRMLEVRAVTYVPERRPVHVVADATPLRVAMTTTKAVLDTVRVTAPLFDRDRSGFQERRRSGMGHYLTAEDIARRNPLVTSSLLFTMPGVRLVDDPQRMDKQILVRGGTSVSGWCAPSLYVDGSYLFTATAEELNSWVMPEEIVGMEIYTGISTPMQFQHGFDRCGAIVVWTRPVGGDRKLSARRVVTALGLMVLGVGLGVLLQR